MLKLNKLVLNGVEYFPTEIMQFDGLSDSSFSFKRDSTYLGMDLEFDVEISFFCDSFKKELDEAYELNNVNNECLLYFDYLCGNLSPLPFVFKADWKTYRSNTTETTFKIKSTSDFAQFLEIDGNEVILDKNLLEDTYIRKIPILYRLESNNVTGIKEDDIAKSYNFVPIAQGITPTIPPNSILQGYNKEYDIYFIGSTSNILNELENGIEITQYEITALNNDFTTSFEKRISFDRAKIFDFNTNTFTIGTVLYPELEYQYIYENVLTQGSLTIQTNGANKIDVSFNPNANIEFDQLFYSEVIIIGKNYEKPRVVIENRLSPNAIVNYTGSYSSVSFGAQPSNPQTSNITHNEQIYKDEKVWIYYRLNTKNTFQSTQTGATFQYRFAFILEYTKFNFQTNRSLNIKYEAESYNVASNSDVNTLTHFLTKSIHMKEAIPTLFPNCIDDFFGLSKNIDTYITNGEYLRSKIEPKDFILKPQEAFKDIEAIFPIALGLDYVNGTYKMRLMRHSDAYLDILYKVYDLVDEVEIKTSTLLVNDVEIGYEIFKDTQLSKNKKNTYNITNQIKNKYQKVSRWIADAYIIYKAIYLGKDIDGKEYDSNIFILSARKLNGKVTTLSNTSGFAIDNVTDDSGITSWINRRFASVFNLLRKNTQWFTSLKQKTELYNNSVYPLNIGTTFYDEFSGTFPNDKKILRSQLVAGGITQKFENTLITFSTPLSENEFIELTTKWYYLIGVDNGKEILYGNVISANLSEGVCEMQLIKRII